MAKEVAVLIAVYLDGTELGSWDMQDEFELDADIYGTYANSAIKNADIKFGVKSWNRIEIYEQDLESDKVVSGGRHITITNSITK